MVYLEHSKTLSFDQERIADAQILNGDVIFRHEDALMYCDSAYFYENSNSLDAFGHVRFEQGDTLRGFCDKLFYDGNTRVAKMRYNVKLVHGKEKLRGRKKPNPTILTTDSLDYDRRAGKAYFTTGGMVVDTLNTLTSVRGQYIPNKKQAIFSQDVKLVNENFTLTSDTLIYNTETKVTNLVSPTTIVYEEETTITTSNGWYNTDSEQSMLYDRSFIHHNDGKTMTGDTIFYDKSIGFGKVWGHMEMCDSTQQATLYGNYGQMFEENSRGYATDSALMVDWSDSLHLAYIHADTLFTEAVHYPDSARQDSTYSLVKAYYGVRVFRDDMQMTCDSLIYIGADSTIHLYAKPICWSENQQVSADSITVYLINKTVDHAIGHTNALCVMEDIVDMYNQMSGKEVTIFLNDGEVYQIDMSGNALTIYFPKDDEDGAYVGMNTTESSFIRSYVQNQEIYRIRFTKETTGILYPMNQIPTGADRLANFFWAENVRPTHPQDVFRKIDDY